MRNSPPNSTTTTTTNTPVPHPEEEEEEEESARAIASRITPLLERLHVLVIGPGLGRDPLMQETCALVLRAARERGMPVVLDADALQIVQRDPALVRGYALAVLTPNVVEFKRLAGALGVEVSEGGKKADGSEDGNEDGREGGRATEAVEALAGELGGVMVLQKGARDHLSDGRVTYTVDLEGGRKRSGGQGDTLTGSIATFLAWRKAYLDGIWETGGRLEEEELVALAVFGGSAITRVRRSLSFQFIRVMF